MKVYVCWVYASPFSKIGCFEKWRRFTSKKGAQKFVDRISKRKNFMFIRYLLVNNMEVEKL